MVGQLVAQFFGNFPLPGFNKLIGKFIHFAAAHAQNMVMMIAFSQFEDGIAAFKIMAGHQSGRFKLCQYTVHRGQANFFIFANQDFVHFFCRQVMLVNLLFQYLQNLHPRQSDLKAHIS